MTGYFITVTLAREVSAYGSENGKDYKEIGIENNITGNNGIVPVNFKVEKTKARYIKVTAKNYGGHPKSGEKVWLFVDEIVVE